MDGIRVPRRLLLAAGIAVALALAAAAVAGLQRAGAAQGEPAISLDAPVSFPVDI